MPLTGEGLLKTTVYFPFACLTIHAVTALTLSASTSAENTPALHRCHTLGPRRHLCPVPTLRRSNSNFCACAHVVLPVLR
ncbi:hypothetical protein PLICRDRAFT_47186 [Plicaturopsis crispa FD-325 SS-3]|uniref:Uncharacterized protein n=1 Tax=Plicaturopsis crispa FD-325 SS-3 TaxID=944288 RepID=A0A0C9T2Q9_PLICR|nr:hypothetical protein PLICRDRAFT_47186 [Plicaturopsis crispa FD-325 SS-3]